MDRRGFLKLLPVAVGGIALAEAIPMGRVWSFPTQLTTRPVSVLMTLEQIERIYLAPALVERARADGYRFDALFGFGELRPEHAIVNRSTL